MSRILVFIFALIALSNAHNWLTSPVSFNDNMANTNVPCETATIPTNAVETVVTQTSKGGSLSATYTNNHPTNADNVHYLYLVPESDMATLETDQSASIATSQNTGTGATLTWSKPVAYGFYILQFKWETWRNCALISITPPDSKQIGSSNSYSVPYGTYDATTGTLKCNVGYKANSQGECKMNAAAAFFTALFVILIVIFLTLVILVVLRRVDKLPPKLAAIVEKGENKVFCCRKGGETAPKA